jgi:prepilin-type N-terminal cleavage/methylation domain-containing protein
MPAENQREQGFTMIELMIAMLVLAIVMTAIGPAFYGELKAAAAANFRSTANGLAVGAIEEMRAFPYYEVGWNATDYSTSTSPAQSCVPRGAAFPNGSAAAWNAYSSLDPVQLTSGSALDNIATNNLPTTQVIGNVQFNITRCVYWGNSSVGTAGPCGSVSGCSDAYKLTWVGVSWSVGGIPWHVSQTSALYPGGEGKYSAKNNNNPSAPACTIPSGTPAAVTSLTATQDTSTATSPTNTIDLTWSEGTDTTTVMPVQYAVSYNSTGPAGPWTPFSQTGLPSQNVDGLASGTTYWFQVVEVACDGTLGAATVVSQATASAAQSCTYGNFKVTTNPGGQTTATIDSNDKLSGGVNSFQMSVNVSTACSNIAARYSPTNNGSYVTDTAPAGSGTLTWNSSAPKWAAGTITFTLYVGGTATTDAAQVTISCNAQHC